MTDWRRLAANALLVAVVIVPALLAVLAPDGFQWGDGKGGHR